MQKTTNYYSTAEDIAFSPLNYWDQPKAFTIHMSAIHN